jgi:hypothetical protein
MSQRKRKLDCELAEYIMDTAQVCLFKKLKKSLGSLPSQGCQMTYFKPKIEFG